MADNVTTPINNGTVIAADEVNNVLYPRTKISYGTDGLATDVSASNPLPSTDAAVKSAIETLIAKIVAEPATDAKLETLRALLAGTLRVDGVIKASSTSRSGTFGTTSSVLMVANANRRGFSVQNQSDTATIYINGTGVAVTDSSSLRLLPGEFFESSQNHSGTSAINIISTEAATPVYAREW